MYGGQLELTRSDEGGSTFTVLLPGSAVQSLIRHLPSNR